MTSLIIKLVTAASIVSASALASVGGEQSVTKDDAVTMVKSAVSFIREQGPEKAYAEITNRSGRFVDRDLYIVVLALDGRVLAHGADPDLIGADRSQAKDVDGKLFVQERIELAKKQTSFWQSYQSKSPVSKDVQPKDMYCERLNDTVVCGGVYMSHPMRGRSRLAI
jgi:cytochrome c